MAQIIKDYLDNYSQVITVYQTYTSDQSEELQTEVKDAKNYSKKVDSTLSGVNRNYMNTISNFDKKLKLYDYVGKQYDPTFEKIYSYIVNHYQFINEQREMNTNVTNAANVAVCQYQRLYPDKKYKVNYCQKNISRNTINAKVT